MLTSQSRPAVPARECQDRKPTISVWAAAAGSKPDRNLENSPIELQSPLVSTRAGGRDKPDQAGSVLSTHCHEQKSGQGADQARLDYNTCQFT